MPLQPFLNLVALFQVRLVGQLNCGDWTVSCYSYMCHFYNHYVYFLNLFQLRLIRLSIELWGLDCGVVVCLTVGMTASSIYTGH